VHTRAKGRTRIAGKILVLSSSHARTEKLGRSTPEKSRPAINTETRPLGLHTGGLRRSQRNQLEIQCKTCTGPREQQASGQNLAGSCTRTARNEPKTCATKEHRNRERTKTKIAIQILQKSQAK
jgi:hypothetical protein